MEIGVQRVPMSSGRCWLCRRPAVAGERLPGHRHKVRPLCRTHDRVVFGPTSTEAAPADSTPTPPPREPAAPRSERVTGPLEQ
jgi:hypothetical protein